MAFRLVAAITTATLGGCATPPPPQDADAPMPQAARCLRVATIDNWRVIDSRNLIVYGPGRDDAWHLRLLSSCHRLRSSETIAFQSKGTTEICGHAGEWILLRGERCAIRSVRAVSPVEAAALLEGNGRSDIGKLPPTEDPQ